MKVIATKSERFSKTYLNKGDIFDVLLHIKPSDGYELVLIDFKAGARDIRHTDTVLYKAPSFHPNHHPLQVDLNKYCWLRFNTQDGHFDEAKLFEVTKNADATILLKKGF
jgi:hypothetical protein